MSNTYKQPIPRDLFVGRDGGTNLAEPITIGQTNKRVLLNLSYGSDMFGRGKAEAVFYRPHNVSLPILAGRWEIIVLGVTRFKGFLTDVRGERMWGGNLETLTFTDVLQGWDVLLTNKRYPATPNDNYTVGNLLQDLVNGAVAVSGVGLQTILPMNNTLLSALYEGGVYEVVNSTYLAEIQRVCQNLGYLVFCDVATGKVSILDPFNLQRGVFVFSPPTLINASFSVNYLQMASTVFVNDDISLKGDAYGSMGTGVNKDNTVFNFSGINNIAMATTVGVKDNKLAEVAKKLWIIGKNQSRVLTVSHAGGVFSNFSCGAELSWTDFRGATGSYTIAEYETVISRSEYKTTYGAYVKI